MSQSLNCVLERERTHTETNRTHSASNRRLKWDGDVKQRELSVDNGLPHWKEAVVFPLGCAHEEGGGVPDPRAQISKEGKV